MSCVNPAGTPGLTSIGMEAVISPLPEVSANNRFADVVNVGTKVTWEVAPVLLTVRKVLSSVVVPAQET